MTKRLIFVIISLRTFVREVKIMTISMLLRTFFEIILFVAVIWCIFHEDRLAAFEKRILCNIKRRRLKVVHNNPVRKQPVRF